MLALVVSDNFLQLFFGWEGVGLCSYLLINLFILFSTCPYTSFKLDIYSFPNRPVFCGEFRKYIYDK